MSQLCCSSILVGSLPPGDCQISPNASQGQPDDKSGQLFHYEEAQQQKREESFALEQWSS